MNFVCQIDETMMGEDSMLNLPRPKAEKKKDIQYGPAPKYLIAAVRKHLQHLVDLPDLDANIGAIGRFANQAEDLLSITKAPMAVMRGEHEVTVPGVADSPTGIEAYGAQIIRQIIPALSNFQKAQNEGPEAMVNAIAIARRCGMDDVAAEMEKKLLGKALDGERPVDLKPIRVSDYLAGSATPVASVEKKRKRGRASAGELPAHIHTNGTGQ